MVHDTNHLLQVLSAEVNTPDRLGARADPVPDRLPTAADGLPAGPCRLRDDFVLERLNHHLVMLGAARAAGAPPVLRRGCSTAKASRRRRPAGPGATTPARRVEGHRAPRPRRHRRSSPGAGASPGRHPGPRRRRAPAGGLAPRLPVHRRRSSPTAATPGSGLPAPPPSPSRSFARNPDQVGFAVQPRRWVVERFFAWIGRNRRLAKDFEATPQIRPSIPLRRLHHAAHPTARAIRMTFKSNS